MLEPMTVRAEIWPVAADEVGIWLLSGPDAWRTAAIMADSEPHAEVEFALASHDVPGAALLHSTSWRTEDTSVILTYVAVINAGSVVRAAWPSALPVTAGLAAEVDRPPTHAPNEAPAPRYVDVLMHGLRHLKFLLDGHDATSAAAMGPLWEQHLAPLAPALAGMYDEAHQAAG